MTATTSAERVAAEAAEVMEAHSGWHWVPATVNPNHLYECICGIGLHLETASIGKAHRAHLATILASRLVPIAGEAALAPVLALADEWSALCDDPIPTEFTLPAYDVLRNCANLLRARAGGTT